LCILQKIKQHIATANDNLFSDEPSNEPGAQH